MLAGVALLAIPSSAWGRTAKTDGSQPASARIAQLVTHVPATTLDAVGAGQLLQQDFFGQRAAATGGGLPRGARPGTAGDR
jgi:hypothetical protein